MNSSASSISLIGWKTAIQRTAILTFMPLPSSVKEAALMESFCGQTLRVIRQS